MVENSVGNYFRRSVDGVGSDWNRAFEKNLTGGEGNEKDEMRVS